MPVVAEQDILLMLQKRDESALEVIRKEYGGQCFRLAHDILGCSEDAEECLSDLLLRTWQTIPPNHPDSLRAYLITLVRHLAIDRYHAQTAQKRGGHQFQEALDELGDTLTSDENVNDVVDRHELSGAINSFLGTLTPRTRNIFLRRYYMSESIKEIAERYDMSVSATKISLMRTREKLQKYLRKKGLL